MERKTQPPSAFTNPRKGNDMKKLLMMSAAIAMVSTSAYAGSVNFGDVTENNSRASAQAEATAVAIAAQRQEQAQLQLQGQQQSISGNSSSVNIQDRLQAPSMGAPSMSSGHPCAYGGASFALSIVGGGASGGGNANKLDDACMLAQMGYQPAAMLMIAQRNPAAAQALQATGYVAPAPTATASSKSVRQATVTTSVHYGTCERRADGKFNVSVAPGGDQATAITQCRAALN